MGKRGKSKKHSMELGRKQGEGKRAKKPTHRKGGTAASMWE